MGRTISIGAQSFEFIRKNDYFFIDKSDLIREWWENGDAVTLVTRPRRFGKTLNLDMMNCFFFFWKRLPGPLGRRLLFI